MQVIREWTPKLARDLRVIGLINIQYCVQDNQVAPPFKHGSPNQCPGPDLSVGCQLNVPDVGKCVVSNLGQLRFMPNAPDFRPSAIL